MSELAKVRRSKGLSQRALAEEAGVSPSSIYEIETGRRRANPSTLRKIADALGVEVADLLEEEERPKVPTLGSPKEWLRAHNARLLALSEAELSTVFETLYPGEEIKFADRINKEWQAVEMARDLAPDPEDPIVREAYRDATSRYFQAVGLAPVSTSFDPDNPEKPETVTIYVEKPKSAAHRAGRAQE